MTKRKFLILSTILLIEISIGYGMAFALPVQEQQSREPNPIVIVEKKEELHVQEEEIVEETSSVENEKSETEEKILGSTEEPVQPIEIRNTELTPQGQLAVPPETITGIYLTSWSAGSSKRIEYVLDLAKKTNVNAVVIDVKDFSGQVAYVSGVEEVKEYGAQNIRIWDIQGLLKKLHAAGIYTIARITVFQDPVLSEARPDLAVQSKEGDDIWRDYKGLGWIDPASQEAWNYTIAIARDAAAQGFDEINFDYVRFPSDGNLQDMEFPFWDGKTLRREVLKEFFAYLEEHLSDVKISADLFGLSTSSRDDLGIGQVIEDAYWHFDYVYPMVYASHYASGFRGHPKPAEYPYEVVLDSMTSAQARLDILKEENPEEEFAELRPWLQDFDLGAEYDDIMVQSQVEATKKALGENFVGFLMWAPTNIYTEAALKSFVFDKEAYDEKDRTTKEELQKEIEAKKKAEEEAEAAAKEAEEVEI